MCLSRELCSFGQQLQLHCVMVCADVLNVLSASCCCGQTCQIKYSCHTQQAVQYLMRTECFLNAFLLPSKRTVLGDYTNYTIVINCTNI